MIKLTSAQHELFAALIPLAGSEDENSPNHRGFMYEISTTGRRGRLDSCGALYRRGVVQSQSDRPTAKAWERRSYNEGYVWLTPQGLAMRADILAAKQDGRA
jgi:hypothetical protein